eukprot:GHVQ01012819.1.p1 GENE.GHVQ01012819.1~~GHVQ01012819.1.p1  ORF type:complete len:181 (+),score=15.95 GHVQ01012819.1:486-1028(+)
MFADHPNYIPGADPAEPAEFATMSCGCFWGVEKHFRSHFGDRLKSTVVGYAGGKTPRPTYHQVCYGESGHAEAVQIEFNPTRVSYGELIYYFFQLHNPTTKDRQANDIGRQYRSAIFTHSPQQRAVALEEMSKIQSFYRTHVVTEIVDIPPEQFWRAEPYHQLYLEKNPSGYCSHKPRQQ